MHIRQVLCKSPECSNGLKVPYFSGCVRLCGKPENWLAHGCNQSTSSWNLEKEFYDVPRWSGFVLPLPFSDSGRSLVLPITSSKSNMHNCPQLLTHSLFTPQWFPTLETIILASWLRGNVIALSTNEGHENSDHIT